MSKIKLFKAMLRASASGTNGSWSAMQSTPSDRFAFALQCETSFEVDLSHLYQNTLRLLEIGNILKTCAFQEWTCMASCTQKQAQMEYAAHYSSITYFRCSSILGV